MNWEAVGAIGEVVGAIAVVATLFYFAIQIRNSVASQKAVTADAIYKEWREHQRDTYVSQPHNIELYVRGLKDFEALSAEEKRRFNFILSSEWLFIENLIRQYQYGNVDDDMYEAWMGFFASQITCDGGAQWWQQTKSSFLPAMVELMDTFAEHTTMKKTVFDDVPYFDPDGASHDHNHH